jgi:glycosyltransferase involved in cell wall biosynthesis
MFARELGGELYLVHFLKRHAGILTPLKYILQAVQTLYILFKDRAQMIHVQMPPFVCALVVYIYCKLTGAKFVLDQHSGSFWRIWDWALPLHKFLVQRAVTNIVTHQHWADIVEAWGGHALIIGDAFLALPPGEPYAVAPGFNIVFASIFAPDVPFEAILQAARQLPDVRFYVTGNPRSHQRALLETFPDNVVWTGFLPDDQYIGLLRAADAIMALTKRNYTLQLTGCEAVSIGKPLITSDWPFLREFFPVGTVYVSKTPESICEGVRALQNQYQELESEMQTFKEIARANWRSQLAQLNALVKDEGF